MTWGHDRPRASRLLLTTEVDHVLHAMEHKRRVQWAGAMAESVWRDTRDIRLKGVGVADFPADSAIPVNTASHSLHVVDISPQFKRGARIMMFKVKGDWLGDATSKARVVRRRDRPVAHQRRRASTRRLCSAKACSAVILAISQ